jgi:4-hydroxy-3-polyprenylbenzoate decarboxylase
MFCPATEIRGKRDRLRQWPTDGSHAMTARGGEMLPPYEQSSRPSVSPVNPSSSDDLPPGCKETPVQDGRGPPIAGQIPHHITTTMPMVDNTRKIVVAIGGSSGSIYAKVLFDRLLQLSDQWSAVGVVMSDNARFNWTYELGDESYHDYPFDFFDKQDFKAPFASGSARYDTMIACPCSMGLLGRIAAGVSDDLVTRAADVMLKERRRLILVPRETPLHLLHLRNMVAITEAGGIICPASPSFYSRPADLEALVSTVTDRVLDLAGFSVGTYRWGSSS